MEAVASFARQSSLPFEDVVVVQADADTFYEDGYIDNVTEPFVGEVGSILVEGIAEYPPAFAHAHRAYVDLLASTDGALLAEIGEDEDNLVADFVAAYRLSDYVLWGGHREAFEADGLPLHAETTRLYLRALTFGATKVTVDAVAHPSPRDVESDSAAELATAGFPRDASWAIRWLSRADRALHVDELVTPGARLEALLEWRRKHVYALFGALPWHVRRALGRERAAPSNEVVRRLASALPFRDRVDLRQRPGVFLEDVLCQVTDGDLW